MSDLKLDGIILHYAVTDRKHMLELVKSVKPEYLSLEVQPFYTILLKNFIDPSIKEVLTKVAMVDYCESNGLGDQAAKIGRIYDKALSFTLDDTGVPPDPRDLRYYVKKVKDRHNMRVLRESRDRITNALNDSLETSEINKLFEKAVSDIYSINRVETIDEGSVGIDSDNMWAEYNAIKESPEEFRGITVGLPSLDSVTNGFSPSELIIVAGMSGTGKSLLMMNFAINAWLGSNKPDSSRFVGNGHNVIYYSLEMPRSNKGKISTGGYFNKRVLSNVSELPLKSIRNGCLTPEQEDHLKLSCDFIREYDKKKQLYVIDIPRGATPEDIEAKYLEAREKMESVDMVVVDYLGIMAGLGENEDDWKAIGKIAASLHEMSRTYLFPVISASQMNRPTGANQSLNNQKYNNTRIARGSGVVDNANIIMQIANRDDEDSRPDMPVILTKVRDGAKGELLFTKAFDRMRVYDGSPLSDMSPDALSDFE